MSDKPLLKRMYDNLEGLNKVYEINDDIKVLCQIRQLEDDIFHCEECLKKYYKGEVKKKPITHLIVCCSCNRNFQDSVMVEYDGFNYCLPCWRKECFGKIEGEKK